MSTETILDIVCKHYSCKPESIIDGGQTDMVCVVRNSFLFACKYAQISNRKACLAVNRHHATIYNSLRAITLEMQRNKYIRMYLFNIINDIKQHEKEDPKFIANNAVYRCIVDAIL